MASIINSTDLTRVAQEPAKIPDFSLPDLPQELINYILLCLDVKNTSACSLVSRQMHQMTHNEDLWRMLFHRDFNLPNCKGSFSEAYRHVSRADQLQSNMIEGIYASYPLQRYMQGASALIVAGGQIFVGCHDNTIKVWDIETGKCLHIFRGHRLSITALAIYGKRLFSGSDDCTIKCWYLETGACLNTSKVGGKVTHLIVADEQLFSGSIRVGATTRSEIKSWDLKTGVCLETLVGFKDSIRTLAIADGTLFLTFYNSSLGPICRFDLKTRGPLLSLLGHIGAVNDLAVTDVKLIAASDDGKIRFWSLMSGALLATSAPIMPPISKIAISDKELFGADLDGNIYHWDLNTGSALTPVLGAKKINALCFADGKLFSASWYTGCMIHDFKSRHRTIFAEILDQFRSDSFFDNWVGRTRFSRLPKKAKDKVFGQLYLIMKPFKNDYWGCAENAFFCRYDQDSTSEQRVQAIENYLKLEYPNEPYSEHGCYFEEIEDDRVHYPPLLLDGIAAAQGVYELVASRSPQLLFNVLPVLPDQLAAASARLHNLTQISGEVWQTFQRLYNDPLAQQELWQTFERVRPQVAVIIPLAILGAVIGAVIGEATLGVRRLL